MKFFDLNIELRLEIYTLSRQEAFRDLRERLNEHLRLRHRPSRLRCGVEDYMQVTFQLSDDKFMQVCHEVNQDRRLCEIRYENVVRLILCEFQGRFINQFFPAVRYSRWVQRESNRTTRYYWV